jgi:serine/threonine protein kinase
LNEVVANGASVVLAFEFCPSDLAAAVRAHLGPLPPAVVKGVLLQLVRGVEAIHSAHVLHRVRAPFTPSCSLPLESES